MLDRNKLILEDIIKVEEFDDHMEIKMKWATALDSKSKVVDVHINYFDPEDCYKMTKSGKIHPFVTHDSKNAKLNYRGSRISAESFVYLAYAKNHNISVDTYGYCADVLDGSGTLIAREKHNLGFNISPSNLQWVSCRQNLLNGQHNEERTRKQNINDTLKYIGMYIDRMNEAKK